MAKKVVIDPYNPVRFQRRLDSIAARGTPDKDGFKVNTLADSERAHPGKDGWKPRHGQDAIGKVK